MDREFYIEGRLLVCRMPEEIDHHRSTPLARRIDGLIDGKNIRNVILDFENTTFMDSSGIGFLIGRSRKLRFYGGSLTARNLKGRARLLFMASGMDQLIRLEEGKEHE